MNLSEHIEIDPNKRFGKPILIGSRISVCEVLNWLANGMSTDDILSDFPELTRVKINACLMYSASHASRLGIASSNDYSTRIFRIE